MKTISEKVKEDTKLLARSLINDMIGRSGFDGVWEAMDQDVRTEMKETWSKMIEGKLLAQRYPLENSYSNMADINHPDAEWIHIHWIKDGKFCYTRVKGKELSDNYIECEIEELPSKAVAIAFTEMQYEEVKNFVFYECFENGIDYIKTTEKALKKYSAYELRAFFMEQNNPSCIERVESIEKWIEDCMWKREDLYWENHPLNQD